MSGLDRRIGDIRDRDGGSYEVLTQIDTPGGETWEPAGSFFVRNVPLEMGAEVLPITIEEALRAEGWTSPDDPLPVCGAPMTGPLRESFGLQRHVCLLRVGHEGDHTESGVSWR